MLSEHPSHYYLGRNSQDSRGSVLYPQLLRGVESNNWGRKGLICILAHSASLLATRRDTATTFPSQLSLAVQSGTDFLTNPEYSAGFALGLGS